MALTFSWVPRNGPLQADVPVSHFEPGVAAASGWQVVVECRFRADPGAAWGAPTIQIKTPPDLSADYTPPADGWVQATIYSIQDGRVSWDAAVVELRVFGGDVVLPREVGTYVDQDANNYADQAGNHYEG